MAKLVLECRHCQLTYAEYTAQVKTHWSGLRRTVTACTGCRYRGSESAAPGAASKGADPTAPRLDQPPHPATRETPVTAFVERRANPPVTAFVERRRHPSHHFDESLHQASAKQSFKHLVNKADIVHRASGIIGQWEIEASQKNLHLVWDSANECGNAVIDGEHKELYALANAVMDATFGTPENRDAFHAAFNDLLIHLKLHFAHEEALLEQHHYARFKAHKAAHSEILIKGDALHASAQLGLSTLGDLMDFTVNVVSHHLLTMDKDFAPLFKPQ